MGGRNQLKEQISSAQLTPQVVKIAPFGQLQRLPAPPQRLSEPIRCLAPGAIAVQHAKDDARSSQPAESVGREIGAAGAEGR